MHDLLLRLNLPKLPERVAHFSLRLAGAIVLMVVGIWIIGLLANLLRRGLQRGHLDPTLVGLPSASLIAAVGAAGLAVGLALQSSLSNLAWGVLLIVFRPFRVGDFVQFGAIMGTVERVDLMQTYLTMPDNRQAIVPNAKVGGDAIINYNRLGQRRFEINVDVGYDADIGQAIEIVRGLFEADARILKDPAPGVWVCALDAKAKTVELVVRAWVHVADLWEAQTAFMRAVKEKFEAEGVTAPSSQHEITVKQVISATQAELRP